MAELLEVKKHKADVLDKRQQPQQSRRPESRPPSEEDWMSKAEVQERLALLESQVAAQQARSRQEADRRVADAEARAAAAQAQAARATQACLYHPKSLFSSPDGQTSLLVCDLQRGLARGHAGSGGRSGRGGRAAAQRCGRAQQGGARGARRGAGARGGRGAAGAARRRGGGHPFCIARMGTARKPASHTLVAVTGVALRQVTSRRCSAEGGVVLPHSQLKVWPCCPVLPARLVRVAGHHAVRTGDSLGACGGRSCTSRWSASGRSWARPGRRTGWCGASAPGRWLQPGSPGTSGDGRSCRWEGNPCQRRLRPVWTQGHHSCLVLAPHTACLRDATRCWSLCDCSCCTSKRVVCTLLPQDIQAAIGGMRQAQQVAEARIAGLEAMRREARSSLVDSQKSCGSSDAAVQLPADADMRRLADALDVRERSLAQLEERLAQQQDQHAKVRMPLYKPLVACRFHDCTLLWPAS